MDHTIEYDISSQFLLTLGSILLVGLLFSSVAQRSFLPRATLLLVFGAVIGEASLDLIPDLFSQRFELIADITLLMVGFLLGGKLTLDSLRGMGRPLLWISLTAALTTAGIVALALTALGLPSDIAILLGCIAAGTAPAATTDTVIESRCRSPFSRLLLAVVAIDDAWALILFSLALALVSVLNGMAGVQTVLMQATYEILGAIALGVAIGLPAAIHLLFTVALGVRFPVGLAATVFM